MRVCFVNQDMSLGGSATVVHDIISNWPEKNDELFLIVFYDLFSERYKDLFNKKNLKVYILNRKSTLDIGFLSRLKKTLKIIKPDIINSHLSTIFYLKIVGATKNNCIYHTIHSEPCFDLPKIYRIFLKKDIKFGRIRLIGCCDYISKKASDLYKTNCLTITNGVTSTNEFVQCDGFVKFLFVGRLCDVKNVKEIIKSFNNIKRGNFVFNICGFGSKKYQNEILELIKQSQNSSRIHFLGRTENVNEVYKKSDVLILASKREGLPITILEGLSFGLAFIATDVGGVSEYVKNGFNGILIEKDGLDKLPLAIDTMLDHIDQIKNFQSNSQKILSEWNACAMAKKYKETLKQ